MIPIPQHLESHQHLFAFATSRGLYKWQAMEQCTRAEFLAWLDERRGQYIAETGAPLLPHTTDDGVDFNRWMEAQSLGSFEWTKRALGYGR